VTRDRDEVAALLPAYEVGPEIGRGTWGVVHGGRHRTLGRAVAIKHLPRAFAADARVRERFVAEARAVAALDHPHVVPVYDFVEHEGLCVLVMEHLPGGTLWDRATTTGVRVDQGCAVLISLCAALQHAHEHGIVHRDVKPENILFTATGAAKLVDFGIAHLALASPLALTATGVVLGTPGYLAPEQATGAPVSAATDVYAVGVTLYETLTGVLPHGSAGDVLTQLRRVVFDRPRPIESVAPGTPPPLVHVTMRALSKDPADRQPSAAALGEELATAAGAAFGPGWLAATGVPVVGAPVMVAAAARATGAGRKWDPPVVRPRQVPAHGAVEVPLADQDAVRAAATVPPPSAHPPAPPAFDPARTGRLERPDRIRVGGPGDAERERRLAATVPPEPVPPSPGPASAAVQGFVAPPDLQGLPPLPYDGTRLVPSATDDSPAAAPTIPPPVASSPPAPAASPPMPSPTPVPRPEPASSPPMSAGGPAAGQGRVLRGVVAPAPARTRRPWVVVAAVVAAVVVLLVLALLLT
jgi:hypothetical protein